MVVSTSPSKSPPKAQDERLSLLWTELGGTMPKALFRGKHPRSPSRPLLGVGSKPVRRSPRKYCPRVTATPTYPSPSKVTKRSPAKSSRKSPVKATSKKTSEAPAKSPAKSPSKTGRKPPTTASPSIKPSPKKRVTFPKDHTKGKDNTDILPRPATVSEDAAAEQTRTEPSKDPFYTPLPEAPIWHRFVPSTFPFAETPFIQRHTTREFQRLLAEGANRQNPAANPPDWPRSIIGRTTDAITSALTSALSDDADLDHFTGWFALPAVPEADVAMVVSTLREQQPWALNGTEVELIGWQDGGANKHEGGVTEDVGYGLDSPKNKRKKGAAKGRGAGAAKAGKKVKGV